MRNQHHTRRGGFTLLELLIVMSIIAVLMTLSVATAFRLMAASQTGATRTLLTRLEERLKHQMTVKADRAREQTLPAAMLTGLGVSNDLARVIYVKLRLKADFPMSFREALDPSNGAGYVVPVQAYVKYLRDRGITLATAPATPAAHESACLLYLALKHGNETTTEEDTGTGGAVKQVNGFDCYVDAWGQPLIFCRVPRGTDPNTTAASAPFAGQGQSIIYPAGAEFGFDDPMDPKNLLLTPTFYSTYGGTGAQANAFRNLLHPIYRRGASSSPRPILSPVVISSGPDKTAGVNLLTLQDDGSGASHDNVLTEKFK